MKVFLSWSGERSHRVAKLLNDWLGCVIQVSKPWISSRNIDRGALWFSEINDQLQDTHVGVVCLTQENKDNPWILFESGALAKGLSTSRVCTLLVDLLPKDIGDPLAQLNHTLPNRDSIFALVQTLNSTLAGNALDFRILEQVFNTYWPQFEEGFSKILGETVSTAPSKPRPKEDMLAEILENSRMTASRMRRIEKELDEVKFRTNIGELSGKRVRDEIRMLLMDGVPEEIIVRNFGQSLPSKIIRNLVSEITEELEGRRTQ